MADDKKKKKFDPNSRPHRQAGSALQNAPDTGVLSRIGQGAGALLNSPIGDLGWKMFGRSQVGDPAWTIGDSFLGKQIPQSQYDQDHALPPPPNQMSIGQWWNGPAAATAPAAGPSVAAATAPLFDRQATPPPAAAPMAAGAPQESMQQIYDRALAGDPAATQQLSQIRAREMSQNGRISGQWAGDQAQIDKMVSQQPIFGNFTRPMNPGGLSPVSGGQPIDDAALARNAGASNPGYMDALSAVMARKMGGVDPTTISAPPVDQRAPQQIMDTVMQNRAAFNQRAIRGPNSQPSPSGEAAAPGGYVAPPPQTSTIHPGNNQASADRRVEMNKRQGNVVLRDMSKALMKQGNDPLMANYLASKRITPSNDEPAGPFAPRLETNQDAAGDPLGMMRMMGPQGFAAVANANFQQGQNQNAADRNRIMGDPMGMEGELIMILPEGPEKQRYIRDWLRRRQMQGGQSAVSAAGAAPNMPGAPAGAGAAAIPGLGIAAPSPPRDPTAPMYYETPVTMY